MHACTYCGSEYTAPLTAAECHDPAPEQPAQPTYDQKRAQHTL